MIEPIGRQILTVLYSHRMKDPNDISNPTMSLEDLSERVSGFYTSDLNALVKQNLIEFCGGVRITGTGCIYYLKFTLSSNDWLDFVAIADVVQCVPEFTERLNSTSEGILIEEKLALLPAEIKPSVTLVLDLIRKFKNNGELDQKTIQIKSVLKKYLATEDFCREYAVTK